MTNQLPFKFPSRYTYAGQRLEGGQGYVYLCKDSLLQRTVAVKVVSTPSSLIALKKELSFLTQMRSPHIAEVYDLLEASSGKHIGLVQQYISGKHLLESKDTVTLISFLNTIYQLSCGIKDVHFFNKVHRDIKPSNIRFDAEGILKILDFGISIHLNGEAMTQNGKGTMPYLAPEMYTLPATYTSAVDVYALGVLAHQLAFGKLSASFNGQNPQANEPAATFSKSLLGIPAEIASLLDAAVSAKPSLRPTASGLQDAFARRLNFGKHRATITHKDVATVLNSSEKQVVLTFGDCAITIGYDGLRFLISAVKGSIDVNNIPAKVKQELPASCVLTLTAGSTNHRQFITVDMSHPGILL